MRRPSRSVRQAGQGDIDFADTEIGALDKRTVADRGKRRDHERAANGIEHAAAVRVDIGMQEFARAGQHLVDHQHDWSQS